MKTTYCQTSASRVLPYKRLCKSIYGSGGGVADQCVLTNFRLPAEFEFELKLQFYNSTSSTPNLKFFLTNQNNSVAGIELMQYYTQLQVYNGQQQVMSLKNDIGYEEHVISGTVTPNEQTVVTSKETTTIKFPYKPSMNGLQIFGKNYTYKFKGLKISDGGVVLFNGLPCIIDLGNGEEDGAIWDSVSNKVCLNQGKSKFQIEEL